MALSNTVAIGMFLVCDYWFAEWFQRVTSSWRDGACPIPIGMGFGIMFLLMLVYVGVFVSVIAHSFSSEEVIDGTE